MTIERVRIFKLADFEMPTKQMKPYKNGLIFCRKLNSFPVNNNNSTFYLIKHNTLGLIIRIIDYVDGNIIKISSAKKNDGHHYLNINEVKEIFKIESIFHYYY